MLSAFQFFPDKPDVESNNFNFDIHADQLYDLIKNEITDKSFAICLNGEWGSGKTSLLKRVYNKLRESTKNNDKFKILWFDAWQYERLDPVLALLQKIAFLYEEENRTDRLKTIITSLTLVAST